MMTLLIFLGWAGLAIGALAIAVAIIMFLVALFIKDKTAQANSFKNAGKFLLMGILVFAIGYGSCAISLSQSFS